MFKLRMTMIRKLQVGLAKILLPLPTKLEATYI